MLTCRSFSRLRAALASLALCLHSAAAWGQEPSTPPHAAEFPQPSDEQPDANTAPAEADGAPSADQPPAAPSTTLPTRPAAPPGIWGEPEPPPSPPPDSEIKPSRNFRWWTLSAAVTHSTFGGEGFSGGSLLFMPSPGSRIDTVILPRLGAGTGFQLATGFGVLRPAAGTRGGWISITYGATWLSPLSPLLEGTLEGALFHEINVPVRITYRVLKRLAPYVEVAMGGGWFDLSGVHGQVDLQSETFERDSSSTHFSSLNFAAGVGSLFLISDSFGVDAYVGGADHIMTSVGGYEPEDTLSTFGWVFRLGPAIFL